MNSKTPARYTLNDINSRRDALRAEMLASSERITDLWHDLVTPPRRFQVGNTYQQLPARLRHLRWCDDWLQNTAALRHVHP